MGDLIAGPATWAKSRTEEQRPHFGFRRPRNELEALSVGIDAVLGLCRPEDLAEQDRIKRTARSARAAYEGKPHVHPSLLIALAADAHSIAERLSRCADIARSYGLNKQALTLVDLASLTETIGLEVEAPAHLGAEQ